MCVYMVHGIRTYCYASLGTFVWMSYISRSWLPLCPPACLVTLSAVCVRVFLFVLGLGCWGALCACTLLRCVGCHVAAGTAAVSFG